MNSDFNSINYSNNLKIIWIISKIQIIVTFLITIIFKYNLYIKVRLLYYLYNNIKKSIIS